MSRCFEGRTTRYLSSNLWAETVTHLHEQSPSPVSGKTTRDITLTNSRGEEIETRTEAFIDGMWYTISRNRMTYNAEGKRIRSENLAGQVTTTAWDCCHKVSETYPVRYTYDIFGNKTTMMTYRDETSRTGGSPVQGDVTTWLYDSASGSIWDLGKDGMTLTMSAWKGVCYDRL